MRTRKITLYGMLLAVAMLFSYVEQMIPISLGVPGVKMGLSNIVTMIVLTFFGPVSALLMSAVRILLTGILFGNTFSIVYSAAGALLSILTMEILQKSGKFGLTGISLTGGIFHNVGQILIAALVLENQSLFYYLPVLILSGLLAGILVGVLSGIMMRRMIPVLGLYQDEEREKKA